MAELTQNRRHNLDNPAQTTALKLLCVCSAGLLRSPTAAQVLGQPPFNYNTRAVGTSQEYALTPVDIAHIVWADEIVTMSHEHTQYLEDLISEYPDEDTEVLKAKIITLSIPDRFVWGNRDLQEEIKRQYLEESCG